MKRNPIESRILILLVAALFLPALPSLAAQQSGSVRQITVTAKKYEFDPSPITVKQGERVKLIITALDRTHGFQLQAYNINEKLTKGKPVTVEFTATKAGTFDFRCSTYCGFGHRRMKGELIVEPAGGAGEP